MRILVNPIAIWNLNHIITKENETIPKMILEKMSHYRPKTKPQNLAYNLFCLHANDIRIKRNPFYIHKKNNNIMLNDGEEYRLFFKHYFIFEDCKDGNDYMGYIINNAIFIFNAKLYKKNNDAVYLQAFFDLIFKDQEFLSYQKKILYESYGLNGLNKEMIPIVI